MVDRNKIMFLTSSAATNELFRGFCLDWMAGVKYALVYDHCNHDSRAAAHRRQDQSIRMTPMHQYLNWLKDRL